MLHLFSGPAARLDGLSNFLRGFGLGADDVDHVNTELPDQDLADNLCYGKWLARVKAGEYDFVFLGTPCETFSHARHNPPGPRPLRSAAHPWGLPSKMLSPSEREELRLGNLFAARTLEICWASLRADVGFAVENPAPWPNCESLFVLPEMVELIEELRRRRGGDPWVDFDQCEYGAAATKPTRLLYFGPDFSGLAATCSHPRREFFDDRGRPYRARHERTVRRQNAAGNFDNHTKALGAYPALLNRALAATISRWVLSRGTG